MKQILILGFNLLFLCPTYGSAQHLSQEEIDLIPALNGSTADLKRNRSELPAQPVEVEEKEKIDIIPALDRSSTVDLKRDRSKRGRSSVSSSIERSPSMFMQLGQSTGSGSLSHLDAQSHLLPVDPDEITVSGSYIYHIKPGMLTAVINAIKNSGHQYKDFRKRQPTAENK